MTSRIGYNVHATSPDFDKGKLLKHLAKVRPAWMLVMDGLQVCRDIKAAFPECNVIHRAYPDDHDDLYKKKSPEQWVAEKKREIGDADVWVYTLNEMGFGDQLLKWFAQVVVLAAKVNLKVVIGNFSVGTPEAEQWSSPAALNLLSVLSMHRDTAVLAVHEYACGVITSGFLGGYPNNAGVVPGIGAVGYNLIPPKDWPSPDEAHRMTKFHMGRFNFMLAACAKAGVPPPRVVITEWGFDDVSDIKPWAETLPKTSPYTTIRAWKSHEQAWTKFFRAEGWSAQRAMFEQLIWADQAIYQGTVVEGQAIFSWGHSSISWDQFDVSQAFEFQSLLEIHAATPNEPPVPTTPTYPKLPASDDARWQRVIAKPTNGNVNVRNFPTKSGGIVAFLKPGDIVHILPNEASGIWMPVRIAVAAPSNLFLIGWVSTDVIAFQDAPEADPPETIQMTREEVLVLAGKYHSAAAAASEDAQTRMRTAQELQALADELTHLANR